MLVLDSAADKRLSIYGDRQTFPVQTIRIVPSFASGPSVTPQGYGGARRHSQTEPGVILRFVFRSVAGPQPSRAAVDADGHVIGIRPRYVEAVSLLGLQVVPVQREPLDR